MRRFSKSFEDILVDGLLIGFAIFFLLAVHASTTDARVGKTLERMETALPQHAQGAVQAEGEQRARLTEAYGKLPLHFIENQGQVDEAVRFYEKGNGHATWFARDCIYLGLPAVGREEKTEGRGGIVKMVPLGMNEGVEVIPVEPLEGRVNYFSGNNPEKWRSDIPTYRAVLYREVYPGVDIKFYGNNRQLEYDIIVKPGADPSRVQFAFEGADHVEVTPEGDLSLRIGEREIIQRKPITYQEIDGARVTIYTAFQVQRNEADPGADLSGGMSRKTFNCSFNIAPYDRRHDVVIDPVLVYSTYLGGSLSDSHSSIAVDGSGNAYIAGTTNSSDFPTKGALYQTKSSWNDVFVTKLNASGSALVYSTYLGGSQDDEDPSIAVDGSGNAYVAGWTNSSDFPTQNALYSTHSGWSDIFVTKLNASGSALIYSTYLGGTEDEGDASVAVDGSGNAYVAGKTESLNFPTKNAFRSAKAGGSDVFVTKLNASGSALIYSTYLGGSGDERDTCVAVDGSGSAILTGETNSSNFPTKNALYARHLGGTDIFVTKLSAGGSALIYSTYLGGSSNDQTPSIAMDGSGNVYIAGWTYSSDYPMKNAYDCTRSGSDDIFVTKLNRGGSSLVYSTYLGGNSYEKKPSIAVDSSGNAYIAGTTESTDFPTKNGLQMMRSGGEDVFVTKLNASGSALIYSTYLGGSDQDDDVSIAVDDSGNAYITGTTDSTDFPHKNALEPKSSGYADVFVARIFESLPAPRLAVSSIPSPQAVNFPFDVTITARKSDGTIDTGFNREIALSCGVPLHPTAVNLAAGKWSGQVTLLEGGENLVLNASGEGRMGSSNTFDVPQAGTASIGGRVQDNRGNGVAGATVYVSSTRNGAPVVTPALSDPGGQFSFKGLSAGTYYIWATLNSKSSSKDFSLFIPAGQTTALSPLMIPLYTSGKTPVILIPGILGSTDKKRASGYIPRFTAAYKMGEDLQLHDPLRMAGWRDLKDILRERGLDEGTTIIDCPWDWRVPLEKAVDWYLKPAIKKAQRGDTSKKVNIIAHSMGGLLARAYIQSNSYLGEIENLTMVGTPHLGSTNAYCIWEGGDPIRVDNILDSSWVRLGFYWFTTQDLYEEGYKFGDLHSSDYTIIKNFVQKYVPTMRQLMPTYKFLNYDGSARPIYTANNRNEFLKELNANPNRKELMGLPDNTDGKIATRVYFSNSEPTLQNIDITFHPTTFWTDEETLYEDGAPKEDPVPVSSGGDGTVPTFSARQPCNESWADCHPSKGGHASLVKVNALNIVNDLYPKDTAPSGETSMAEAQVSSTLQISFTGRVQPLITDPKGRKIGVNFQTGALLTNVPGATIETDAEAGNITIDNPLDGAYTLSFKGRYTGDFRVNVSYLDSSTAVQKEIWEFNNKNVSSFKVTLASGTNYKIAIPQQPAPPTKLTPVAYFSEGLKTKLTWTASTTPNVSYRVYVRGIDSPYFALAGTTTDTKYSTAHPWSSTESSVTRVYAVSAVDATGMESFLVGPVLNNDRDRDGLTDADESRLGTKIANADSDGDGLKDGTEARYQTHPLLTDTDGDGYSDSVEIEAKSDPLDPESIP